jgi:hypothetical protein
MAGNKFRNMHSFHKVSVYFFPRTLLFSVFLMFSQRPPAMIFTRCRGWGSMGLKITLLYQDSRHLYNRHWLYLYVTGVLDITGSSLGTLIYITNLNYRASNYTESNFNKGLNRLLILSFFVIILLKFFPKLC